jgi:CHAT domain-containing protein
VRQVAGNLIHNKEETGSAHALWGGVNLVGNKATKAAFWSEGADAQILHLALHATAHELDPMRSALYFADADPMYAAELYAKPLGAELTILSSCNSGTGPVRNSEGVMSLGRAFAYSGCPSMVVARWQADDKVSSTLISTFMAELRTRPIAQALQEAKVSHIAQSDLVHPYYWGGLVLVGKNAMIQPQTPFYWPLVPFLLLVIGFGGLIFREREKNKETLLIHS